MNEQKAREVGVKIIDIMQNSDLKSSEAILVLANVFVSGWLAATNGHPDGRAGLL